MTAQPYRLVTARGRPGDFRVPVCTWGEPADARDGVYHRRIDFHGTDELSWSKATTNYCVNYCVNYCDTTVTHVVNSRMLAALRCAGQQAFRPHCASSIPG